MILQAVTQALAQGFAVFPVAEGGKTPHPAAGYRDATGFHGWGETATKDPNIVLPFFATHPNVNYGIACLPSELLVVDLDKAKEPNVLAGHPLLAHLHDIVGPYVDADVALEELMYALGGDPADLRTFQVHTGSGGLHLYYRWPASWPKTSQASPVKGLIDVRGNGGQHGGYVLGPGSRTEAGWYRVASEHPLQLAPTWLRALVVERPAPPRQRGPQGFRQPAAVSFAGLVESVENAQEGNRNNALLWAARAMCADGASYQEACDTLGPPAYRNGLGDIEIERTIQSGYRLQEQKGSR